MSRTIDHHPIRHALVSVYDKTGLTELASALVEAGVTIYSTGSTAATIAAAGLPVTPVEDVTGFPECLDGRVKTLHPRIHAGILADRRKDDHVQQLEQLQVTPIDLVVCNLYPFTQTVASGADYDACVEQIDIGGPSMVRAAAKNHAAVAVVTNPAHYDEVRSALGHGGFTLAQRRHLAAEAFSHTADYDAAVSSWMVAEDERLTVDDSAPSAECDSPQEGSSAALPPVLRPAWRRLHSLRYGENPHQAGAVYVDGSNQGIAYAEQLHGKAMSFNNYTDADAAVRAAYDHTDPCVAVCKHANPCGIATAADVATAHRKAHACDPVSAFGGVIAVNRPVTVELAEQIVPIFTEVVVAPDYEDGAVEVLARKKNLRVLRLPVTTRDAVEIKPIGGGVVAQRPDRVDQDGDRADGWTLVAGEAADADTLADLEFAWRTVRAVKSNAVLLAHDCATVGIGMGQVNRVDSCKLAIERANTLAGRETGDAAADKNSDVHTPGGARASDVLQEGPVQRARGAVAASDAFFPFADGLQLLIDAGVRAVVQPGGSIRDQEVIDAAQAAGITMYLTGTRHFFH